MQNKILIANRGEIAVRIIRACKELGINCVAVYSSADKDSAHVKFADEAICIGSEKATNSYLSINNIVSAAIATGCNAIHPGYGFLSENEKFVEIVEKCNLKFIGPSHEVIEKCGNKSVARKIAQKCKVPVVSGSDGIVKSVKEGLKIASSIGYPILIKAANGGGGKGISLVNEAKDFENIYRRTVMEAEANFGCKDVYIEKFIVSPRHIEVQILADAYGNVVHLGERDCSIQRRNQKVIEEAPSPFINAKLREELGNSAIKIAKEVGYESAGTVEFIVDKNGNYYFIEMNTRIQVEHPVTELVTGIDIVKEQIKIAYKQELTLTQKEIKIKGCAIECRINAEDPTLDFRPSPGVIKNLILPGGNGIRLDTHLYSNYEVPPYYDSLLAKVISYGNTRKEAVRKMRVALEQFVIDGIKTNIEFQYLIMHNPEFVRGIYDTGFINWFITTGEEY
mgnify:FL=1